MPLGTFSKPPSSTFPSCPGWLLIHQGTGSHNHTAQAPTPSAQGSQEVPHLAGRDIESTCPQIHPLKGVNEGQEQNHAGPLRGADPAQSKHNHPLIGGHNLFMRVRERGESPGPRLTMACAQVPPSPLSPLPWSVSAILRSF